MLSSLKEMSLKHSKSDSSDMAYCTTRFNVTVDVTGDPLVELAVT